MLTAVTTTMYMQEHWNTNLLASLQHSECALVVFAQEDVFHDWAESLRQAACSSEPQQGSCDCYNHTTMRSATTVKAAVDLRSHDCDSDSDSDCDNDWGSDCDVNMIVTPLAAAIATMGLATTVLATVIAIRASMSVNPAETTDRGTRVLHQRQHGGLEYCNAGGI